MYINANEEEKEEEEEPGNLGCRTSNAVRAKNMIVGFSAGSEDPPHFCIFASYFFQTFVFRLAFVSLLLLLYHTCNSSTSAISTCSSSGAA